jgi:quercetin dioxygenase-like cupin family protein
MPNFIRIGRSIRAGGCLLVMLASAAVAAGDAQQQALALAHDDPQLEWGPCPEFLPEGCAIAVLHGDPAGDNADIFFKVPAGSTIPNHWHTSAERMILVSGEMRLTYEGQQTQVLRTGMYAYGPARLPHEGSCAEGDPCILFIAFESPVDAIPVETMAGH